MRKSLFAYGRRVIAVLLIASMFFLSIANPVQAQSSGIAPGETATTSPKLRDTTVTAKVSSRNAPPAPILKSPANGSLLTSGVVTWQWYEVETPYLPLDHYEFYLNGSQPYDHFPLANKLETEYSFSLEDGIYTLALKPAYWLPDGVYTWRVRVLDSNDVGTDSTTWTFTVDSTPPHMVVRKIDNVAVTISSQDVASVPSEPVMVATRKPYLSGTTEAGSEIQLTQLFPDGTKWQATTTADNEGRFAFQLAQLPVTGFVKITLVAIDAADLMSVITDIPIAYQQPSITIPLPPPVVDIPGLPPAIVIPLPPKIPTLPSFPLPSPSPALPLPDVGPTILPATGVTAPYPWFWWALIWGLLVAYWLLRAWQFGVPFTLWPRVVGRGFWWWLLGDHSSHRVMTSQDGSDQALPLAAWKFIRVDGKRTKENWWLANPTGRWVLPPWTDQELHLEFPKDYLWPLPDQRIGRTTNTVHISGATLTLLEATKQATEPSQVRIPIDLTKEISIYLWTSRPVHPRTKLINHLALSLLILSLLLGALLVWYLPSAWAPLPLIITIIALYRGGRI